MWLLLQARSLPTGYGVSLLQTLLALGAVCILAWVVLRWGARAGLTGLGGRGARVRILERVVLDPRRALYLVKIGERVLLLGAGESGPPALLKELELDDVPVLAPPPGVAFADVLARLRRGASPPAAPAETPDKEADGEDR